MINFDILKCLLNLECEVFGKKLDEIFLIFVMFFVLLMIVELVNYDVDNV